MSSPLSSPELSIFPSKLRPHETRTSPPQSLRTSILLSVPVSDRSGDLTRVGHTGFVLSCLTGSTERVLQGHLSQQGSQCLPLGLLNGNLFGLFFHVILSSDLVAELPCRDKTVASWQHPLLHPLSREAETSSEYVSLPHSAVYRDDHCSSQSFVSSSENQGSSGPRPWPDRCVGAETATCTLIQGALGAHWASRHPR